MHADELLKQMLKAAGQKLGMKVPAISGLAKSEFKKLSQNLVAIEKMKLNNTITEQKAKLQIEIQKNALKTVILTEKGLSVLAVEDAINAALDVISKTVNTSIGWILL